MNLSEGCVYCNNLLRLDSALTKFECSKNTSWKLENAGASFIRKMGTEEKPVYVIVENCPFFEKDTKSWF